MSSPPTTPSLPLGSTLRRAWTEVVDENFEELAAAGFDDLRPVHHSVLREILESNLRPSELAARLGHQQADRQRSRA